MVHHLRHHILISRIFCSTSSSSFHELAIIGGLHLIRRDADLSIDSKYVDTIPVVPKYRLIYSASTYRT